MSLELLRSLSGTWLAKLHQCGMIVRRRFLSEDLERLSELEEHRRRVDRTILRWPVANGYRQHKNDWNGKCLGRLMFNNGQRGLNDDDDITQYHLAYLALKTFRGCTHNPKWRKNISISLLQFYRFSLCFGFFTSKPVINTKTHDYSADAFSSLLLGIDK